MAFFEALVNLIAPHACLLCYKEGELLCRNCAQKVAIVKRPICYKCKRLSDGGKTCASCSKFTCLSGMIVAAHYGGVIRDLIRQLKDEQARAAAEVLATFIIPHLDIERYDLVTAIPAESGRRGPGYNQSELMAKTISRGTGLPYVEVLRRVNSVHPVAANHRLRPDKVNGNFMTRRELFIKDARVLVVDSVVSAEATLAECAKVLKQAGARQVWAATVVKR